MKLEVFWFIHLLRFTEPRSVFDSRRIGVRRSRLDHLFHFQRDGLGRAHELQKSRNRRGHARHFSFTLLPF